MKWRSKATGIEYDALDSFDNHSVNSEYLVAIFSKNQDWTTDRPRARLTYSNLLEAFEKVEE
jgi:hypothetical protein